MGSTWGNTIKISIFGESHGHGHRRCGSTDSRPVLAYDEAFVLREMERRAPAATRSTARKEPDRPEIQSGIYNGKRPARSIRAVIRNTNQRRTTTLSRRRSRVPATQTTGMLRYDSCKRSGGGHFSGRLTARWCLPVRCASCARRQGVTVGRHIQSIAQIQDMPFDDVEVTAEQLDALRNAEYPVNNPRALEAMLAAIEEAREEQDSVGGVIECRSRAPLPYRQLDARQRGEPSGLHPFGVPAVKGVEFGAGFARCSARLARERPFYEENGVVKTETNNNGGISAASRAACRSSYACIKPTPSIGMVVIRSNIRTGKIVSRCPSTAATTRASSPAPRRWSRPPEPLHWQIF